MHREMTKFSRTRSSGRQGNSSEKAFDGLFKSPACFFRFFLHCLFCFAALTLGFRITRDSLFVVVPFRPFRGALFSKNVAGGITSNEAEIRFPYVNLSQAVPTVPPPPPADDAGKKSSRVHVGRHEILIRSWPHPDPVQSIVAHRLLDLVQHEQRQIYGPKARKQLIIITPTFVRTFQALHLNSLIHTLRVVPGPVMWIVVEASGISNETATLLASSHIAYHHLSVSEAMPEHPGQKSTFEAKMRLEALRYIRDQQMDGVVLFADDSNMHSLDLFDEAQNVHWLGTFSIGFLSDSESNDLDAGIVKDSETNVNASSSVKDNSMSAPLPVQGPACGLHGDLTGWYVPSSKGISQNTSSERNVEWAGFMLNARILWRNYDRPNWIRDFNEIFNDNDASIQSPLDFVTDASHIEPLGYCGKEVLIWWLRVEAHPGSGFPSRWIIDPPLEVVVPSKHTTWSDIIFRTSPPPPSPPPPSVVIPEQLLDQHNKQRSKGRGKGRKRNRHKKQAETKLDTDQLLSNKTNQN